MCHYLSLIAFILNIIIPKMRIVSTQTCYYTVPFSFVFRDIELIIDNKIKNVTFVQLFISFILFVEYYFQLFPPAPYNYITGREYWDGCVRVSGCPCVWILSGLLNPVRPFAAKLVTVMYYHELGC